MQNKETVRTCSVFSASFSFVACSQTPVDRPCVPWSYCKRTTLFSQSIFQAVLSYLYLFRPFHLFLSRPSFFRSTSSLVEPIASSAPQRAVPFSFLLRRRYPLVLTPSRSFSSNSSLVFSQSYVPLVFNSNAPSGRSLRRFLPFASPSLLSGQVRAYFPVHPFTF